MTIKENKYLEELLKNLSEWNETSDSFLRTNDINGVDLIFTINEDELELDCPEGEALEELESYFENQGYHYFFEEDEHRVSTSSCEDIFITFDNNLIFPNDKYNVSLGSDAEELEIYARCAEFWNNEGIYSGIWQLDYYGSPSQYSFSEDTTKHFNEHNEKERAQTVVELYDTKRSLDDRTVYVADLPYQFVEVLPEIDVEYDEMDIIEMEILAPYCIVVTVEVSNDWDDFEDITSAIRKIATHEKETKYGTQFSIKINTLPQVHQVILEL